MLSLTLEMAQTSVRKMKSEPHTWKLIDGYVSWPPRNHVQRATRIQMDPRKLPNVQHRRRLMVTLCPQVTRTGRQRLVPAASDDWHA